MDGFTLGDLVAGSEERLGIVAMTGSVLMKRKINDIRVRHLGDSAAEPKPFPGGVVIMAPGLLSGIKELHKECLQDICESNPCCVFLSRNQYPPDSLKNRLQRHGIALFTSFYDEHMLESRLLGLFNEKLHQRTTMHGVLVKKAIRGILIIGDSGSGKTASAMKLIERGYRWVADDVIQIERKDPEKLHGSGHGLTGRLIEIKGRGIVDSRSVFDSASLCSEAVIDLVISLSRKTERDGINSRHRMGKAFIEILGIRLPKYTLRSSRSIDETVDRIDSIVSRHGCSGGLP